MKITTTKNTTSFYIQKKDGIVLKKAINSVKILKHYIVEFSKNRFILRHRVTSFELKTIMQYFEVEEQKKEDLRTVVSGFTGCLITGFNLEWV